MLKYALLMKQQTTPEKPTKRQEAQDPLTEPARLLGLARSSSASLGALVAKNPNATLQVLSVLAEKFPREVLQNPALSLFLLENPQSLLQLHSRSLRSLLWCEEVPPLILRLCAASPDAALRGIVATCPKTPLDLLQQLSRDPAGDVRSFVARHPTTDLSTLERLCSDREHSVRVPAMRRCPSLVASLGGLASLFLDRAEGYSGSWLSLLKSSQQKLNLQALYLSGGELALSLVALSKESPAEWLEALSERISALPLLCSSLLANPALPEPLMQSLLPQVALDSEDSGVFFQPRLPEVYRRPCFERLCQAPEWLATKPVAEWVYELLFQRKKKEVWLGLARNPGLPALYFQPLYDELDFQLAVELAQNPSTPAALLESLATAWRPAAAGQVSFDFTSEHMRVVLHKCLAQNPSLPTALFTLFAESKEPGLLKSLASNPNVPLSLLEELSRASHPWVRVACASHPRLSGSRCRALAEDPALEVRQQIAARGDLTAALAHALWRDEARVYLASNPQTPAALLERLVAVAPTSLARNPNAPPALLARLSREPSVELQALVARHESTPAETLRCLSGSSEEVVRVAAFLNPNLELAWLYQRRYVPEELPF